MIIEQSIIILAIYSRNHSYCSCTWIPESYVAPAVQFCGIMLVGTNHFWLPPFGSLLLNSILMDRGPLGGETAAHTAPRVRLRSWHVRFTVCIQPSTGLSDKNFNLHSCIFKVFLNIHKIYCLFST